MNLDSLQILCFSISGNEPISKEHFFHSLIRNAIRINTLDVSGIRNAVVLSGIRHPSRDMVCRESWYRTHCMVIQNDRVLLLELIANRPKVESFSIQMVRELKYSDIASISLIDTDYYGRAVFVFRNAQKEVVVEFPRHVCALIFPYIDEMRKLLKTSAPESMLMNSIERLVQLKTSGMLNEDEFTLAKRKLLADV